MLFSTDSLPSGYTRIECYECNGGVYFDLGEKISENSIIELSFALSDTANQALFGCRKSAFAEYYGLFVTNGYFYASYNGEYRRTTLPADTHKHEALYFADGLVIDDITLLNFSRSFGGTAFNLFISGCNYSENPTDLARCKLYSFKLYNGAALVRDLVPCVRGADGQNGFYDRAEGRFYTPIYNV